MRGRVAGKPAPPRTEFHRARQETVARITHFLEAQTNGHTRLADLCEAVGVSERTLRAIFHDAFGIGPGRYLRVRRLELIRVALAMAEPTQDTVAAIAARYGFSDGGRMAKDYLLHFGEYPSATLARPVANSLTE
jgi:AraC family ethanolamine operon transcriptional activator